MRWWQVVVVFLRIGRVDVGNTLQGAVGGLHRLSRPRRPATPVSFLHQRDGLAVLKHHKIINQFSTRHHTFYEFSRTQVHFSVFGLFVLAHMVPSCLCCEWSIVQNQLHARAADDGCRFLNYSGNKSEANPNKGRVIGRLAFPFSHSRRCD
jgi:hypothetical protein